MVTPAPILRKSGKPLTFSWSGRETFDGGPEANDEGCVRKWWYGYMEGLRTATESTIIGGHVHRTAEAYLLGQDVDTTTRWWRILEPGLPFAPTPDEVLTEGWRVEDGWRPENGLTIGPLPFVGAVDFYHLEKGLIGDWKTTGDAKLQWVKTPERLRRFGQPLLYAKALYGNNPPPVLTFQHINLVTKGAPQAMSVVADNVPWDLVEEMWEDSAAVASRMAAVATNHEDASTVPANTKVCGKFGGCGHAQYCAMSPVNRTKTTAVTTTKEPTMSTAPDNARLAAIRATLGLPDPAGTTPAAAAPPAAAAKPAPSAGLDKAVELLEKVLAGSLKYIPASILANQAKAHNVTVDAVRERMGLLRAAGDRYVRDGAGLAEVKATAMTAAVAATGATAAVAAETAPAAEDGPLLDLPAGTPWAEVEALATQEGIDADELADGVGMRRYAGMAVPVAWRGTVEEAKRAFDPVTKAIEEERAIAAAEVAAAEVAAAAKAAEADRLDKIAKAAAEAAALLLAAEEREVANAKALAALANAPAPAEGMPTADAIREAVVANRALNGDPEATAAADALFTALKASDGVLTKASASTVVRSVLPDVQRVKDALWTRIAAASNGQIEVTPTAVRLVGALTATPAAPERTRAPATAAPAAATTSSPSEGAGKDGSGTEPPPAATSPATGTGPRRCTVLIDALPIRQEYVEFGDWVRAYEEQVEAEAGVPHYGVMPYATGPNAVVARVKAALYKQGLAALPRLLVMSSFHPLAPAVLPLLQRVDGVAFIKGVR